MRNRRRCTTLPCSVVLHAAAAAAVVTLPLLVTAELPGPAGAVKAFFVEPIVAPPPPPPPPAAPADRAVAKKASAGTPRSDSTPIIPPLVVPDEVWPEEGLDLGLEGGVPGGVAGGVPGGVVGAIVGGFPDVEDTVPPPMAPLRVGHLVKEPVKARHVNPVYPEVAIAAQVEGIVIIEAVVDENGRVVRAEVLQGVPILEGAALDAVRQWVYTPTLLDGVPTPIIMTVTVNFELFRPGR
jgi:protein TonB